jgi:general secretion pathway protein H
VLATASLQRGVIMLDAVLTLIVAGLVLLLVLPLLRQGTSPARHAGYAYEIAALLKADRSAAAQTTRPVATSIDVNNRQITSGSRRRAVVLPNDLVLDVLASNLCATGQGTFAIAFAADGRSCGTVITLAKGNRAWRIRVNWLTGFVDTIGPSNG